MLKRKQTCIFGSFLHHYIVLKQCWQFKEWFIILRGCFKDMICHYRISYFSSSFNIKIYVKLISYGWVFQTYRELCCERKKLDIYFRRTKHTWLTHTIFFTLPPDSISYELDVRAIKVAKKLSITLIGYRKCWICDHVWKK